jgi:hypothetical protein
MASCALRRFWILRVRLIFRLACGFGNNYPGGLHGSHTLAGNTANFLGGAEAGLLALGHLVHQGVDDAGRHLIEREDLVKGGIRHDL